MHIFKCAIPVFNGLLPEPHNRRVIWLLFVLAHWHGLAKLRMHTDLTLDVMEQVTSSLGHELRTFKDKTCTSFQTRELQWEFEARIRKKRQTKVGHANARTV